MLAYHEGWIDCMWCPFFGDGCEVVARSPQARHAGIPNAAVGAALTWEMGTRVRAWCFWCLASAGINTAVRACLEQHVGEPALRAPGGGQRCPPPAPEAGVQIRRGGMTCV